MRELSKIWRNRKPLTVATWLSCVGIVVGLGILGFGIHTLAESRRDAWSRAEQSMTNLTLALGQDITHSLSIFSQALSGAEEAYRMDGVSELSPELRQAVVFSHATAQADFGSMIMLDRDGWVVLGSNATVPLQINLSDRDYFTVHRDEPHTGLFVSRPFISRFGKPEPSIALSRRLSAPNGDFVGVVAGSVRISFFRHLLEKLNLGQHGSVRIMRTDGSLISRFPEGEVPADAEQAGADLLKMTTTGLSGQFIAPSSSDRPERLVAYRTVEGLPLVLGVAMATQDIYSGWWHQAVVISILIITLGAVNITLSLFFRHEMQLRMRVEALLTEAAGKLSVLALTDGLTQIGNRRAFDTELDRVWRAAIRAEEPVALLMLDADHFKAYNDTQGHQAGDEVLTTIAAFIKERLRRPTDFVARYGGEEFVALLPDTESEGAMEIAEMIRSTIARAGITHPRSPHRCVTVSVGVAIAYPRRGQSASVLIQEADAALYRAKQTGRNRVHLQRADPVLASDSSRRLEDNPAL